MNMRIISTGRNLWLMMTCVVTGVCLTVTAHGSSICLTKKQARQLWPKQHLYWYSQDRCWSNRRGPPRNLKMDPIINSSAMAKDNSAKEKPKPKADKAKPATIIYPPLKAAEQPFYPDWLNAFSATGWPPLIDIDDEPDPDAGKDGCCWPRLEQLLKEAWEKKP